MQFATPWDERSAETSYAPEPRLDFDHFLNFGFSPDPLSNTYAVDSASQQWPEHFQVPINVSGDLPLAEPLNAIALSGAGVPSNARRDGQFDVLLDNAAYQYPCTDVQAGHDTEFAQAAPSTSAAPGSFDSFFTVPSLNTSTSTVYFPQQLAATSGGNPCGAFPIHVSPTDLILTSSSDTSSGNGISPYTSPSTTYSYISGTPWSSEVCSHSVHPASATEWTVYSPSGPSPANGSSPLSTTDFSASSSPIRSVAPSVVSTNSQGGSCASSGKNTARRGRPQTSASLSIQSSVTLSSSPGKVRAAAPRNKQVHYEPYEVPDGPLDGFVCPFCEPGRPFATPRRGRRKHDIERHLKTHFSEASRSEGSELQVVCDRVVPIESLPGPGRPEKWWECGGRRVVGGCAKVFGREDSLLRHLKVGCLGPRDHLDSDALSL